MRNFILVLEIFMENNVALYCDAFRFMPQHLQERRFLLVKHYILILKCTGELVSLNINRYKCGYCGACVGVCPKGALELVETWVEVDESTCITCGICDRICPVGAIEVMK
jgi:NAD-dependent dihydropyrimidine dehydrogenase PreA subunit